MTVMKATVMGKMRFLESTKIAGRSKTTFALAKKMITDEELGEEQEEEENNTFNLSEISSIPSSSKKRKRKDAKDDSVKRKVLDKCVELLDRPSQPPVDKFALYVSKKLAGIHGKRRVVVEKKITDLLFEAQMEEYGDHEEANGTQQSVVYGEQEEDLLSNFLKKYGESTYIENM